MPTTPRLALPAPVNADAVAVPADILALAAALDGVAVAFDSGTLAGRPAAGTEGRLWYSTNTGVLSWDTGATWIDVNPTGVVDGPAGSGTLRTLGTGALQAAAGNDARLSDQRTPTDGSVTAAKVANALKPSAGAGGGTEALRALGTAAGQAAAGAHASQHGPLGADPLPGILYGSFTFSGSSNTSTESTITWGVSEDGKGLWAAGSPTALTIPSGYGGVYLISAWATFASDPGGATRAFTVYLGGIPILTGTAPAPSASWGFGANAPTVPVVAQRRLAAGNVITAKRFQDSGGTLGSFGAIQITRIGG